MNKREEILIQETIDASTASENYDNDIIYIEDILKEGSLYGIFKWDKNKKRWVRKTIH